MPFFSRAYFIFLYLPGDSDFDIFTLTTQLFSRLVFEVLLIKIYAANSDIVYSFVHPNKKNQPVGFYSKWLVINIGPNWAQGRPLRNDPEDHFRKGPECRGAWRPVGFTKADKQ